MENTLLSSVSQIPVTMCMDVTDQFEVIRELGKGTYGKVLLAKHKETGNHVALKMLMKSRTRMDTFLVEYTTSRFLSVHPNIIYTFAMAFDTLLDFVFVQEVMPAGTLISIIQPEVGLQEDIVKRCATQLANALGYMHSNGLVHRDLKLDNVLLMDSQCHCIKLADFGLTQQQGTHVPAMTSIIPYMAPELCNLRHNGFLILHPSLDVWAFGVLVYVALTGCLPWNAAKAWDEKYRVYVWWQRNINVLQVPAEWNRLSPEAMVMLCKMLAPNATERCTVGQIKAHMHLRWKVEIPRADSTVIQRPWENHDQLHTNSSFVLLDNENMSLTVGAQLDVI